MTIPALKFPPLADDASSLFSAVNNLITTLGVSITAGDTSITLTDASSFPSTGGFFSIGTECIHYESKTGNVMNVCTRGADGTTAATHNAGDVVSMRVIAIHHNRLKDAIIALQTWAIGGGGGSGAGMIKEFSQTGHGFAVGDVLRWNGTAFVKAQANSSANAEALGIVVEIVSLDAFKLQSGGFCENLTGLTSGNVYFLSDATAGLLTSTEPTAVGSISKPLFIALSTTTGYFFNFRGLEIGPTNSVYGTFTNASLDINNKFTVTHNLGRKYVAVTVIDNNDNPISPDLITYVNDNSFTVDLTEFAPLTGTWRYVVLDGGATTNVIPATIQNDVADTKVEAKSDKTIVETVNSVQARKIHSDGIQDLPLQSRVRAYMSVNQSIAGTPSKIAYNVENYDSQGEYDNVTNYRFTAKKAGYYHVQASLIWQSNGSSFYASQIIRKNGSNVTQNQLACAENATVNSSTFIQDIIYLAAGDYLEFWANTNGTFNTLGDGAPGASAFMAIHKLS